jgi:hypothetical protein
VTSSVVPPVLHSRGILLHRTLPVSVGGLHAHSTTVRLVRLVLFASARCRGRPGSTHRASTMPDPVSARSATAPAALVAAGLLQVVIGGGETANTAPWRGGVGDNEVNEDKGAQWVVASSPPVTTPSTTTSETGKAHSDSVLPVPNTISSGRAAEAAMMPDPATSFPTPRLFLTVFFITTSSR